MAFREPGIVKVFLFHAVADTLGRGTYRKLVRSLDLKGNEKVLDFGSGLGTASRYIAQALLQGNGRLTCVDMSKVWMKIIQKKLQGYPNVEFKQGDIAELDIEEGSYDIVFINLVLHDVEADIRQRTVNALSCALKNSGKLHIKEPTGTFHGMPEREIRDLMNNAGLHEINFKIERSFAGPPGSKYSGVFGKH